MRTQSVSSLNFNGNLKFVTEAGKPAGKELTELLSSKIGDSNIEMLKEMVKNKPYDLFVSENKETPWLIGINANTSFDRVKENKIHIHYISETLMAYLKDAATGAIEEYEKFAGVFKV